MRRTFTRFFLIILIVIILFFIFIHNTLLPVFFSLAEIEAVRIANRSINEAVDREVEGIKYGDLIDYRVDNEGKIVMMQPNTAEINKFSSRVSLNIQSRLERVQNRTVTIPLFRVFGIDLLAGMGPDITARIRPVGFTEPPRVIDTFEAAGINQTRHKIYLQLEVLLKLIIPFSQKTTRISTDIPVVEVTILGRVPEVYVGLEGDKFPGIIGSGER